MTSDDKRNPRTGAPLPGWEAEHGPATGPIGAAPGFPLSGPGAGLPARGPVTPARGLPAGPGAAQAPLTPQAPMAPPTPGRGIPGTGGGVPAGHGGAAGPGAGGHGVAPAPMTPGRGIPGVGAASGVAAPGTAGTPVFPRSGGRGGSGAGTPMFASASGPGGSGAPGTASNPVVQNAATPGRGIPGIGAPGQPSGAPIGAAPGEEHTPPRGLPSYPASEAPPPPPEEPFPLPPTGQLPVAQPGDDPAVGAIGPRLTPEVVRRAEFGRTGLGRRGYSETDVEQFRTRVVQEISNTNSEKAELRREAQRLRTEVQRLRDYYRRQRVDVDRSEKAKAANGVEEADVTPGPSPDAVNLMSQAQQAADQHIAQAEDYVRRLVGGARRQYDEILVSAQEQAERVTAEAQDLLDRAGETQGRAVAPDEVQELHERVRYLRTFAQVTQVQLRGMLDGLRTELDRLTLPEPEAPPSGLGEPRQAARPASDTGPVQAISTPPRGMPSRGTLPVRS